MRALTVQPGVPGSAQLEDVSPPPESDGSIVVEVQAIGVCGTDLDIVAGEYGKAPQGASRLIIGHESLGRIRNAPTGSGLTEGDLVVGIVRRPDPVPCPSCAVGEWDMCRNGRYTECGIKGLHGFARDEYRIAQEFAVPLDASLAGVGVLLEPASVLAKAWDHIEKIGNRAAWDPQTVLVTGAGPVGLMAALMSAQRGLETYVLDRVTDGPKPRLVRGLGGHYHSGPLEELKLKPDIVIECTGVPTLVMDVMRLTGHDGIVCLTGISPPGHRISVDAGQLNRDVVLENDVVFGSVNANRHHYELAAQALMRADRGWLEQMITRRVPLERYNEALEHRSDDVKVVVDFAAR